MTAMTLPIAKASEPAPATGLYLVWPRLSNRPQVLHATAGQTQWRWGATLLAVDYYAGPIPERKQ